MNTVVSESRKLFSLRSTWVYLAVVALGMAAGGVLTAWGYDFNGSVDGKFQSSDVLAASELAVVVMIFASAMLVGADLGKGTVAWSYLSNNRRVGIVLSQFVVILISLLLAATLGILVAILLIAAFGGDINFASFYQWPDCKRVVFAYVEWGGFSLLAMGLAYLLRSGTFAAMILVVEFFVLETALTAFDTSWAKALLSCLPFANMQTLVLGGESGPLDHSRGVSALILVLILALCVGGACVASRRRSVAK
ncbi:ABC transporter permease [Corynebacterium kefirresidentii]|uniref:ABC transporter permease n=1 Tax=Corynebacterium kefirresidentii TaxID=1979527 RepID=UPI0037354A9F